MAAFFTVFENSQKNLINETFLVTFRHCGNID